MSISVRQLPCRFSFVHRKRGTAAPAVQIRCKAGESPPRQGSPSTAHQATRREALFAASVASLWSLPGLAAAEATLTQRDSSPVDAPLSKATRTFNEKDFVLEVPRGFKEVRDEESGGGFASGGRPKSTYERIAAITPLRVKFTSDDERELLTVIQRNASEIKQSFTQVLGSGVQITDISQLGDLGAVSTLLLPREVTVEAQGQFVIPQEDRDTGSFLGTIKVPPQTVYRYTFRTRGQHAHLSVVAKGGKLYLVAGSASDAAWEEASARLKAAVVSFRLV